MSFERRFSTAEDLGDEQSELRLVAGALAPLARPFARELHADADFRAHVVLLGDAQDGGQLFEVLDHGNDGAAELRRDDHRFEIAVVLEAVADDEPFGRIGRHRHHRQQFRLAADFEPEPERLAVAIHLFDDEALLVHLDGEHRGVLVLVVVLGDRLRERVMQMLEPVRQDVREAHDHRSRELALLEALDHVEEVDLARRAHVRADHEVSGGIHAEVALAPGVDLVELGGILDRPRDGTTRSFRAGKSVFGVGCHDGAHDTK
jgi:hypothetical protein